MNPLLYGIFQFLKFIAIVSLRIFYPRAAVINREKLWFDHPAILVSNHANTLLDPLHAASRLSRPVSFLANAGLFSTPFTSWFFNTFYCIPIRRATDKPGKNINNESSFARADEFLARGGILYIAPEGTSEMHRRLRELKTGTARIALSAASKCDFMLDLAIVPVGLTYEDASRFGSGVVVHAGDPIRVADYQQDYEQDPVEAVRKLTQDLENRMRSLVIDTRDDAEEQILEQLETIFDNDQSLPAIPFYHRSKALLTGLRAMETEDLARLQALRQQTASYYDILQAKGLTDRGIAAFINEHPNAGDYLVALLGFPVFLYGGINNFLAAFTPVFVMKQLKLEPDYDATVKILAGLLTFPLFYFLQTMLVSVFFPWPVPLLYLLSLPLTGWLAWRYRKWSRPLEEAIVFKRQDESARREILQLRRSILLLATMEMEKREPQVGKRE